jgi:hypothetical protein
VGAVGKLAGLALVVLAWASLAAASATPLKPAPGAVVATSHPVFTWSVPEGETTSVVYISSSRKTAADGAFVGKNVVDSQVFSNGELRWSPTRPLFAGRYWWSVKTRNDAAKEFHSAPRAFRVRAAGRITSLRLTRYTDSHRLLVTLKWRTNAKTSVVTVRIKRAGKQVWSTRFTQASLAPESEAFGLKSWPRPPGIKQGTTLALTATLQAGSFTRTTSTTFRAP